MYREPAARAPTDLPPTELVLTGSERFSTNTGVGKAIRWVVAPFLVWTLVSTITGPGLALLGVGLVVAFLARRPRAKAKLETRLELDGPDLCVERPGPGVTRWRTPLRAVVDVVLDAKSEQSVQASQTVIYALRYETSRPGPTIETARVVIVSEGDREPIALTETYLASFDATEQMGKVRAFLRKHGWVPEDERGDDEPGSSR